MEFPARSCPTLQPTGLFDDVEYGVGTALQPVQFDDDEMQVTSPHDRSMVILDSTPVLLPDGSTGYLLNIGSAAAAPPAMSLPSEGTPEADSQPFSSPSPPPERKTKQQPRQLKSGKITKAKKSNPKPKKTYLYELDPSTIKDKKEQLKVAKAKRSKAYRDKVKTMAAEKQCCCMGLCNGNVELQELLKCFMERF